jgi:hypothetical protein
LVADPLWKYAVYAVVIYGRAVAERPTVPVEEIARQVAARHGLELTGVNAKAPAGGRS